MVLNSATGGEGKNKIFPGIRDESIPTLSYVIDVTSVGNRTLSHIRFVVNTAYFMEYEVIHSLLAGIFAALVFFVLWRQIDIKLNAIVRSRHSPFRYAVKLDGVFQGFELEHFLRQCLTEDYKDWRLGNLPLLITTENLPARIEQVIYSARTIRCPDIIKIHDIAQEHIEEQKTFIISGFHDGRQSLESSIPTVSSPAVGKARDLLGFHLTRFPHDAESTDQTILIFNSVDDRDFFFCCSRKTYISWIFDTRYRDYVDGLGAKHRVYIDLASAPEETIWQNFGYSKWDRYARLVVTWVMVLAALVLDFWVNKLLTDKMVRSHNNSG